MAQRKELQDPRTAPEALGHWWLPGAEERRVAGRLAMPTEGPVDIELLDLLSGGGPDQRHPVLLGITSDGTPVTLEGLTWTGGYDRSSVFLDERHRRETFMVEVAYVGAHLPETEDRIFTRGVVDFTDLLVWAGPPGFDERYGPDPVEVTIELTRPPSKEARPDWGSISLNHGWAVAGDGVHSRGIEKQVGFLVELKEAADLKGWLSTVIGPLRHLMTFATDRRNEVRDLRFMTDRYKHRPGHEVAIRYSRGDANEATHSERLQFLFDSKSLGDSFDHVIARWFEIDDEIGPIIALLLAHRYRPNVFVETRFIDAVGAAEAYHRARGSNESIPVVEHQTRVTEILGNVPDVHREWLSGRLEHSNEPTLNARLKDLVATSPVTSLGLWPRPGKFAAAIVETRSALVHDQRRRQTLSVTGRDFLQMTEQLRLLVTASLLRDLGFASTQVMEMVRRSHGYRVLTEVFH